MRKGIVGWEDRYQVDVYGVVYSLRTGKPVYCALDKCGYLITQLSRDGKRHTKAVHRIVAEAFLGEKDNSSLTVNHIDGVKTNNCADNLEYVDRSEQMYHAYKLGLKKPVETNRKLTPVQVNEIRRRYVKGKHGQGSIALAREYGVTSGVVLNIANGKSYQWVKEE